MEKSNFSSLKKNLELSPLTTRSFQPNTSFRKSKSNKKILEDRYIPCNIQNSNLTQIFSSIPLIEFNDLNNYQKMLKSEIIDEATPSFSEKEDRTVIVKDKRKRHLSFKTETKKKRSVKINKENKEGIYSSLN